VLIIGVFIYRLDHSRIGRAFESIQTDPDMAKTLGINVKRMTILGLTISSVLGATAGAIYSFNMRVIYPETFGFSLLLSVMTMMFVGGRYTQWGMLISVPLLWGMSKWIPSELADICPDYIWIILILILMVFPEGIINRKTAMRVKRVFIRRK
jgi:branched-chain amino acid transport system permease protein